MTDSLLLAGTIELADLEDPRAQTYTLGGGYSFGDPTPLTTLITSLVLDGDRQTGRRSGNRPHALPIIVSSSDRLGLSAAVDTLLQILNRDTFTLAWTPAGGKPVVWTCSRATPNVQWSQQTEAAGQQLVDVTFTAQPFGRSPDSEIISVGIAQVQIDSYSTVPSGSGVALDTSVKYEGTGSARLTMTAAHTHGAPPGNHTTYTASPISRTLASAVDISDMAALTIQSLWAPVVTSTMGYDLTLHSPSGDITVHAEQSFGAANSLWKPVTFPLTGDLGSFDPTAYSGYILALQSGDSAESAQTATTIRVDDQRAIPPSSEAFTTAHGTVLTLPSVKGSARAPVSLAFARSGGGTFATLLAHRPPVEQDPNAQILTELTNTGTQTVAIPAVGAVGLSGTYDVWLAVGSTSGSPTANTVNVTVAQKQGATTVATATVSETYTDSTGSPVGYVNVGRLTLPLAAFPDDNDALTYAVTVDRTSGADLYTDLLLLDSRGASLIAVPTTTPSAVYYDPPVPPQGVGSVYRSATDRTAAVSLLGQCRVLGEPVLDPGDNRFLMHSTSGPPILTAASYYPGWLAENADLS